MMKEFHKLLSSSIYFSPERQYVFLGILCLFDGYADWKYGYRDRIHRPGRQLFMTKSYDLIMNCFIFAAIFVQFPLCGY